MSVEVFLNFDGNCREAVLFYAEVFGCEAPRFMTFGEMPANPDFPPMSEEDRRRVLYTSLPIAGGTMMFSDIASFMHLAPGNNVNITVSSPDGEVIRGWFARLKKGGQVHMEPQKTFWSDCYAMLVDRFGIPWQLSQAGDFKL